MQTFDRVVASHWKRRADLTPPVAYLYEKPGGECLPDDCGTEAVIQDLAAGGVEIMAPATAALVTSDGHRMVPSKHAWFLNSLGVSITSWSLDRSPCPGASPGQPAYAGPCGGYWAGLEGRSAFDWSDILLLMYTMYHEANVSSAFSDYPAVNSLFLNCVPRMPLGR